MTDSPTAAVSPPPRYPVVLFDLDNTLSDFTSAQSEALPGLLAAHGVAEAESYLPTFKRLAEPLWEQIEAGTLTLDTLNGERFRLLVVTPGRPPPVTAGQPAQRSARPRTRTPPPRPVPTFGSALPAYHDTQGAWGRGDSEVS